jgi:cytochrome c5
LVKRTALAIAGLGITLTGTASFTIHAQAPATPARAATSTSAAEQRAVIDKYCVTCHNQQLKTAGLMLDVANIDRIDESAATWEKVAHMLRTGAMPPVGRPRPEPAVYQQMATWLEQQLDAASAAAPNAGRVLPHRLNRTEYVNAVRDLLDVEISTSLLPLDNSALGFDNIAGALSVSPTLLERYMGVARQVARLAVGDTTMMVAPVTYPVDAQLKQDDRLNESLPFGTRGVTIRHTFPLDGEYVVAVRFKRNTNEYIRGLGRHAQPLDVRLDGARVKVFEEAGTLKGIPPPEGYSQDELGTPDYEKNALDGDGELEARFPIKAGAHTLMFAFPARRWQPDEEFNLPPGSGLEDGRDGNVAIKVVEISGPFETLKPVDSASRRRIYTCRPANPTEETACATTILSSIARRAYRRPLTDADVHSLLAFCNAGKIRGFDGCIESGLERILASPYFLFRVEGDASAADEKSAPPTAPAPSKPTRISDLELASRLSFFLWSSIPDDELLDAGIKGTLHEHAVLEQQVRRMLADARSTALVENFAAQWLELRKLDGSSPVEAAFPMFDGELREAMKEETNKFLESMIREDRPIPDLLTANYSFINERLAQHYGIPNVIGTHFRKVTMPPNRGGLLGQGSILLITSQANRTSPVLRGKWILENVLGAPVPPPPPDVPPLKPSEDDGTPTSIRAALERHRKNAICANCHARMDPWGFALENFDGIGGWRDMENNQKIDTASALIDGTKLDGPGGVRAVLTQRSDQFVTTVTTKLLVYALGRPVEYYDLPALRKITRDAAAHEDRWSSVILGIVNSLPFQFHTSGGTE